MGKNALRLAILLVPLALAPALATTGHASTISWTLPASHADGSPMDPQNVRKITVRVYAGPTKTGPWKWVATSLPGATSVMVMDPAPGHTLWYTATATLPGAESDFAKPVRKTNLAFLNVPFAKKVLRKMITPRKMAALLSLILLVCLAWGIRYRRRRRKQ
jgi:hypothetical protein